MNIKTIAISTGGGDAPGLNAVIRAVVHSAINRGWRCIGIRDGYNGILSPSDYPEGGIIELSRRSVRGITHLGGTIIGTTNRGNPTKFPVKNPDGTYTEIDRTDELIALFRNLGVDALISVGGDGSLAIANAIHRRGFPVVGVPKTIDNDLDKTNATFGFDTAVSFATDCLGRLHSTAEAHQRVMCVEVMGRYAGWIALHSGVAATADIILIPEIPYNIDLVCQKIREREADGKHFSIVVVAEGAKPIDGATSIIGKSIGQAERLGGAADRVARQIEEKTGKETRVVVLGHVQRGGTPSAFDRLIALRFGAAAVRALAEGHSGVMVALDPPQVNYVPLTDAIGRMKTVPLDSDTVLTARELGIAFGD